jgi:sugar phosphate isomerase/epimerase
MHYAISVWNFVEQNTPLAPCVEFFAEAGFDTLSFTHNQILALRVVACQRLKLRLIGMIRTLHMNA